MYILYIGNKLLKHGYSATNIETLGPLLEKEGYTLFYASDKLNYLLRLFDMLTSVWRNRKIVDYILIDTYSRKSLWGTLLVATLCRMLNLRYITILHGGNLPKELNAKPILTKWIFGGAYRLIAPSGYLKYEFEKRGYRVLLIPNNININAYLFKQRDKIKPDLLFVRSFHEVYNPEMAIKVLAKLKKAKPNATLCMIGPDKDGSMERCKLLAEELGVINDVLFTGKLTKEEWHRLSEEYDVFINTTNVDNTPVSVIEAMALGLPVVSTNVDGLPYLLEDGKDALMVEKGDVDGMVGAVIKLIDDDEIVKKLAGNGRIKAESFDWDVVKMIWNKEFKIR